MDPSFNQASGQGQSSMSPTTPSTYQVNVNRTKTRKWVEAKSQNYDGDDWGTPEESEEDSYPPAQTPHPAQAPQPPAGQGLATDSRPLAGSTQAVASPQGEAPAALPSNAPAPTPTQDVAQNVDGTDDKRTSISPQLPNMARMSAFGVDLFADGSRDESSKLGVGGHTIQEEREPSPEPSSTAADGIKASRLDEATRVAQTSSPTAQHAPQQTLHLAPRPKAEDGDSSSVSEEAASRNAPDSMASTSHRTSSNEPQTSLQSGPESQTPTQVSIQGPPNTSQAPFDLKHDNTAASPVNAGTVISPTEPLQPKRPEQSPSDYEPQPLHHTTTFDTSTSSPVKESDVLSEEIIRSLTPGSITSPVTKPGDSQVSLAPGSLGKSPAGSQTSAGGSRDGAAVPAVSSPPIQPTVQSGSVTSPTVTSPTDSTPKDLRRRFSWEALGEEQPSKRAAAAAPVPVAQPSVQSPSDGPAADQRSLVSPSARSSGQPISPTIKIVPDSVSVAQQASVASPAQSSVEQPPPDLSGPSYEPNQAPKPQPLGGPNSASDVARSTPGPTSAPSQGTDKPVMPLREIMNLSTPEERLERYEESRSSIATSDSGLDEWISTMKSQHPEHANAGAAFSGGLPAPGASIARTPSPAGSQPSAQAPYYQQYLNASAPAAGTPPSARSRLAGLQEHAHAAAGSAFGHSSNQIGHKGKEFMQSAGKMGKGLFSKGKSKLRGTGDKAEPPVDRKPPKGDRRASWAVRFGAKPRADIPATQHSSESLSNSNPNGPMPPYAQRFNEGTRLSSSIAEEPATDTDSHFESQPRSSNARPIGEQEPQFAQAPRAAPPPPPQLQQHQQQQPPPSNLYNPNPAYTHPPPASRGNDVPNTLAVAPVSNQQLEPAATITSAQDHGPPSQPSSPQHEDSGVGLPSPMLPRIPSFEGLPPIRRTSVFDFNSESPSQWALGEFSFETGDNANNDSNADKVDKADETDKTVKAEQVEKDEPKHGGVAPPVESTDQSQASEDSFDRLDPMFPPPENATTKSIGVDSNATLVGQESTNRTTRTSLMQKEPLRFSNPPPLPTDNPVAQLMQQGGSNPVQRQPPTGWHLEESHLSAPLHARRRADAESSPPQQHVYPYDKETGARSPASPPTSSRGTPPQESPQSENPNLPPSAGPLHPGLTQTTAAPEPPVQHYLPGQQTSSPALGSVVTPETEGAIIAAAIMRPHSPARSLTQESNISAQQPFERKKTFFGAAAAALPRPSTSGQANETGSIGETSGHKASPKKKLFGFAGRFNRSGSGSDTQLKPGSSNSNRSSINGMPPHAQGGSFDQPSMGRGRSGTTESAGSFGIAPPATQDEAEGRDRGGSVSNMFSSFWKNRSEPERPQNDHETAPAEPGRGSVDGGRRSSRHLSQGSVNPPRPSPLAQEFSMNQSNPSIKPEANNGLRTAAPDVPAEHMADSETDARKPLPGLPGSPFDAGQRQPMNGQVPAGEARFSKTPTMASSEHNPTPPLNQPSAPVIPLQAHNRPMRPTVHPADSTSHLSYNSRDSPSTQAPPPVPGWRPTNNAGTDEEQQQQQQQQQQLTGAQAADHPKTGGRLGFRMAGKAPQAPPTGQKSRWKGWKEKLAGRASQPTQEKPEQVESDIWKHRISNHSPAGNPLNSQERLDRPSGDKLLGAFKRGSKANGDAPQQPGFIPGQPLLPGPPQQFPGQQPYGQYQQVQQGYGAPGGQFQAQQPAGDDQNQWTYQQRMAAHHQHPPGQVGPEPRYGQVPLPQGYGLVHGEGRVVSTGFYVGQPPPQGFNSGQHQYPQQPEQSQQSQHAQQAEQSLPVTDRPLSNAPTTPASQDDLILPIQGVNETHPPMPTLARGNTGASNFSTESGAIGMHAGKHVASGSRQQPIHPQVSRVSINTVDHVGNAGQAPNVRESAVSGATSIAQPSTAFANESTKDISRNVSVRLEQQPKQVTVDGVHESTPRLKQDPTGGSHNISEVSKSNTGSSLTSSGDGSKTTQDANHIELEDTADARMRTMRLDNQEEKIFYEPEPEIPKMTATSYPGQEWNPYGEPEFMAWQDD